MPKKKEQKTRPSMEIFGVTKNGDKSWWTKIGAAWENSDGSFNLTFDFMPTDSKATIQLREPKEAE